MQNSFLQRFLEVCRILNDFSIQYIVIGGTAVGFHGFYRDTTNNEGQPSDKHDFDFWFNPYSENYYNIIKAMKVLGKDVSHLENESAPNPKKSFLRFEFEDFKIDFLPEVRGLKSFNESYSKGLQSKIDDIVIYILSFEDLIITKETNPRQKDLNDILELKRIRTEDLGN